MTCSEVLSKLWIKLVIPHSIGIHQTTIEARPIVRTCITITDPNSLHDVGFLKNRSGCPMFDVRLTHSRR